MCKSLIIETKRDPPTSGWHMTCWRNLEESSQEGAYSYFIFSCLIMDAFSGAHVAPMHSCWTRKPCNMPENFQWIKKKAAASGNPFYVSVAILKLCFSYWCDQVFKSSGHFVAMIQRLTVLVPHRLLISNSVQRQESGHEGSELTLRVYCLCTYFILDRGKILIF